MAKKSTSANVNLIGKSLFLGGVILALLAGLIPSLDQFQWVRWALVVLGLLVGVFNISREEQTAFLVAGIGLLTASTAVRALLPDLGTLISNVFENIIAFVGPGVVVVAIIGIANLARD